jgi:hypothetical protein
VHCLYELPLRFSQWNWKQRKQAASAELVKIKDNSDLLELKL